MAYNEKLADRVREIIAGSTNKIEEKKIFGGLCFMVKDKMCVGIKSDRIMVRISPEAFEQALEAPGFEPMVHNGKTMAGFGFVQEGVLSTKKQLQHWVNLALEFNKDAKPSAKKARKK